MSIRKFKIERAAVFNLRLSRVVIKSPADSKLRSETVSVCARVTDWQTLLQHTIIHGCDTIGDKPPCVAIPHAFPVISCDASLCGTHRQTDKTWTVINVMGSPSIQSSFHRFHLVLMNTRMALLRNRELWQRWTDDIYQQNFNVLKNLVLKPIF